MAETMEHYRCFHCKQVFGPEIARRHFGSRSDLAACRESERNSKLRTQRDGLLDACQTMLLQLGIAYAANPEAYAEFLNEVADVEGFGAAVQAVKSAIAKAQGAATPGPHKAKNTEATL